MGREVRKVPANWEHPKNEQGMYLPMFNENYRSAMDEWIKNYHLWNNGQHPDQLSEDSFARDCKELAEWEGNPPDVKYYVPYDPNDLELCTHYQGYQNTSEGTPITPVFDTIEKCAEYAAEHATIFGSYKASKEKWIEVFGGDPVLHKEGNVLFM